MDERNAHLPVFATDDLHKHTKLNGGDVSAAWEASELCGEHHNDKKELMVARVNRWLKEAEDDKRRMDDFTIRWTQC